MPGPLPDAGQDPAERSGPDRVLSAGRRRSCPPAAADLPRGLTIGSFGRPHQSDLPGESESPPFFTARIFLRRIQLIASAQACACRERCCWDGRGMTSRCMQGRKATNSPARGAIAGLVDEADDIRLVGSTYSRHGARTTVIRHSPPSHESHQRSQSLLLTACIESTGCGMIQPWAMASQCRAGGVQYYLVRVRRGR